MSVEEAFLPEPASEAAEASRRLSSDYKEVFGTVVGERVLQHLLNELCQADKVMRPRMAGGGRVEMTGDNALYFGALRDLAVEVRHLLNMEFRDDPRPAIRHHRFTSRPAGRA
jgi:uncharacterized heparinase superfamily protein